MEKILNGNSNNMKVASSRNLQESGKPMYIIMIDAAYTHTSIYVIQYEDRVICDQDDLERILTGEKVTYVDAHNLTTTKQVEPGIATFAYMLPEEDFKDELGAYLTPLLDFAKETLADREEDWGDFPIYYGCTGGCRMLPRAYRQRQSFFIQYWLEDYQLNPFYFKPVQASVLSGEEQASYEFLTANLFMRTLSHGNDETGYTPLDVKGVIQMSDDTLEVVFVEQTNDIMANSYRLQLGQSKTWNLYSHSYLYSGTATAFDRLNALLVAEDDSEEDSMVYNPCMPGYSQYNFTSMVEFDTLTGKYKPLSGETDSWDLDVTEQTYYMMNDNSGANYTECERLTTELLLLKNTGDWCDFAHDRECGMVGNYMPPPPTNPGGFIGTEHMYDVLYFLGQTGGVPLSQTITSTQEICAMDIDQLSDYNAQLEYPYGEKDLHMMCFMATYYSVLLVQGLGFPSEYELAVRPLPYSVPGSDSIWVLGGAMYHINTFPWKVSPALVIDKGAGLGLSVNPHEAAAAAAEQQNNVMKTDIGDDDSTFMPLGGVFLFLVAMVALVIGVQKYNSSRNKGRKEAEADGGAILESEQLTPSYGTGNSFA